MVSVYPGGDLRQVHLIKVIGSIDSGVHSWNRIDMKKNRWINDINIPQDSMVSQSMKKGDSEENNLSAFPQHSP